MDKDYSGIKEGKDRQEGKEARVKELTLFPEESRNEEI